MRYLFFLFLFSTAFFSQEANAQFSEQVEQLLDSRNRGQQKYVLLLQLHDTEFGALLYGARVTLFDKKTKTQMTEIANNGEVKFSLEAGADYEIFVDMPGYINRRSFLEDCQRNRRKDYVFCAEGFGRLNYVHGDDMNAKIIHAEMSLEQIVIGKTFKLENIYYDLGKWFIRRDAGRELRKLVTILKDNPEITIELGSHTDARGSAESNETLSQKRADSAVEYIVGRGIAADRLSSKGYGETILVNSCSDGVKCSEKLHQANRRTEFKITSLDYQYQPIDRW